MTKLSRRLDSFMFFLRGIMSTPVEVERVAESIYEKWPDIDVLEAEKDPKILVQEMDDRRKNDDWANFYWGDATKTAQAFFGIRELHTDKAFIGLYNFLLHHVYLGGSAIYNRAIFRKYLDTFAKDPRLTQDLAASLSNIESWNDIQPSIDRLNNAFKIFEVDVVVERIANYMDEADQPYTALREIGIEAPHGAGLMQEACKIFVGRLADRIDKHHDQKSIDKLLDWTHSPGVHNGALSPIAEQAVDAILLPWHQRDIGDSNLKDIIKKRLVDAYGDPRVEKSGVWVQCSPNARDIIMRWLVKDTLDVFFEIISLTANERNDHDRMWKNRRNIWFDLYNENRITQAWFALSDEAARTAMEIKRERNMDTIQFAKNASRGSDRYKCLLIMKIDDHWVVEGSYSFPTYIFPVGSSIDGYKASYTGDEFRYYRGPYEPQSIWHHRGWSRRVLQALEQ